MLTFFFAKPLHERTWNFAMKQILSAAIIAVCICGSAIAQDFITPVDVSSSTGANDLWPASNLIQGPDVGYDSAAPHDKLAAGSDGLWVTADDAGFPADYIEEVGMPVLTFDLGSDTSLGSISVWGYSAGNTNGVSEFSLSFATEAEGAGGGTAMAGPFTTAGDLATGANDDIARQAFEFDPVMARYVQLTVMDNFFVAPGDGSVEGTLPGGDRAGLGEVAFQAPIPEPSSIALLLIGTIAIALRRRRR